MNDPFYDALCSAVKDPEAIRRSYTCSAWVGAETVSNLGVAMNVPGEDSLAWAALNAYFNRGTTYYEPFENYCTRGLDFSGKTVGVIGHMTTVRKMHGSEAARIMTFDLEPKDDTDLPAEREPELLPQCDIVLITGSSLINGTLGTILDLCPQAYKILTGPSVPQSPVLLDLGLDRIAGFCAADLEGLRSYLQQDGHGMLYRYGFPFLIQK